MEKRKRERDRGTERDREKEEEKKKMNGDEWLPGGGGANKNGAFFCLSRPLSGVLFLEFRKK